jgi:hypothetical protein
MFDGTLDKMLVLMDAGLKHDQTFAIAMLSMLESYMNEHKASAYNVIMSYSESMYKRASTVFEKFVVGLP